jgi:hypothetical protein
LKTHEQSAARVLVIGHHHHIPAMLEVKVMMVITELLPSWTHTCSIHHACMRIIRGTHFFCREVGTSFDSSLTAVLWAFTGQVPVKSQGSRHFRGLSRSQGNNLAQFMAEKHIIYKLW